MKAAALERSLALKPTNFYSLSAVSCGAVLFSCLGSLTGSPKMPPMKQVLSKLQKYLHQVRRSRSSYWRALPTPCRARHRHRHFRCHLQGIYGYHRRLVCYSCLT